MKGNEIRRIVIEQAYRTNSGHIGSCLSVADILADLYGGRLRGLGPNDPQRDRFVLSKGHAAFALYAALHLRGWLTADELVEACKHGHPDYRTPGVEFSTGSLGMGITYAVGQAYALRGTGVNVYCLVSDAECQEGSVWEAARFAAEARLSNLTVIVDANGMQALGPIDNTRLMAKWLAFGWSALGGPTIVISPTRAGSGVSFMEGRLAWHYSTMSEEQYRQALAELA
jgi:transketolase